LSNLVTTLPAQEFAGSIANVANSVLALGILTAVVMIMIAFKPLILSMVREFLYSVESRKSVPLRSSRTRY